MDRRGTNNRQLVATHVRMIPSHGVPAHPDKQALWTRHEARVGLRIDLRAATVSLPWQRRFPPIQRRVAPHTRDYTRSVCSTPFLFRCAAPDQVRCSRSGAVPARRHRQAAEALPADTASRRATHAGLHPIGMQYTLSVQVRCSRSGALLPIRCCACTQAQTGSGGAVCERPRECSRAGVGRRPRQIRPEPLRPNREAPPPPSERPRGQSPIPSTGLRDPATVRVRCNGGGAPSTGLRGPTAFPCTRSA